jgi:hypothetical protein
MLDAILPSYWPTSLPIGARCYSALGSDTALAADSFSPFVAVILATAADKGHQVVALDPLSFPEFQPHSAAQAAGMSAPQSIRSAHSLSPKGQNHSQQTRPSVDLVSLPEEVRCYLAPMVESYMTQILQIVGSLFFPSVSLEWHRFELPVLVWPSEPKWCQIGHPLTYLRPVLREAR